MIEDNIKRQIEINKVKIDNGIEELRRVRVHIEEMTKESNKKYQEFLKKFQ